MAISARQMAAEALIRVHGSGIYSNVALDAMLQKSPLSPADQTLVSRLFYGVLERQLTLDYILSNHSSMKLKRMHPAVLELLRVGCYQLVFMDKIPASAAVNETVKLARIMKQERSAGFINAVLRSVERDREYLLQLPDSEEGLSIRTSCPVDLIRLWKNAYGEKIAAALAESANEVPPVTIRVNTIKITTVDFEKILQQEDISYQKHPFLQDCIDLSEVSRLKALAQMIKNWYYHQDAASQYCCIALDPKPGERVADVCAAPGGKSFTCAQMMGNQGEILACDLYPAKCDIMEQRARDLGITIIRTAVCDASKSCPKPLAGAFDRVLCDVPCSGFGVIRRKPEIRYKPLASFAGLPELQYTILHRSSQMVRPGGVLQYSTCTCNPLENEKVAERFLQENPDFIPRRLPLEPCFEALGQQPSHQITMFPSVHHTDGFYIAGFERTR